MTRFAVEPNDLIMQILAPALPGVTIRPSIPDGVPDLLPLVVIRRIGGSSVAPRFWDRPTFNIQNWCKEDRALGIDAARAAGDLADQIRKALWDAWSSQTVVAGGHIARVDESQGPMEIGDVDLPHLARFSATYQLLCRPPA